MARDPVKGILSVLLLLAAPAGARAEERSPTAESILEFGGGDAVLTAELTQFPYIRHLRAAVNLKDDGLKQLFMFTDSESFIGSGAESHCVVLRELLKLWGDREFARVLKAESPRIRAAVISALDYAWPHPGWRPTEFPMTYRLAPHTKAKQTR